MWGERGAIKPTRPQGRARRLLALLGLSQLAPWVIVSLVMRVEANWSALAWPPLLLLTLDERLELWADEAALEQVLTNLIENAVKYSDPRNTIKVKLSALSAEELKALNAQRLLTAMR